MTNLKVFNSLFCSFADLKDFFTKQDSPWQDKAIAIVVALSFSLSIVLKERGSLLGLLLVPLLLLYPYGAQGKKEIVKFFLTPPYLLFFGLLATLGFSLLWGIGHNNILPAGDYRRDIFYHGWWVIGRWWLLAMVLSPLWWFFTAKPAARGATLTLLMVVAWLTMTTIVLLVEMNMINHGNRDGFRNDQYSENVAILFLLILPLVFKKNMLAWLCLPLIFLLHLPVLTIGPMVVGYGTARLWTIALFMGTAIYLLLPWVFGLSKKIRIILWAMLLAGYLALVLGLLLAALVYDHNDPYNHPLLQFLTDISVNANSIKERLKFWHFIIYYIIDNPLVGYGLNSNRYLPTLAVDFSTNIFSIPYHAIKGECFLIGGGCEPLNQPHYIWIELLLDAGLLAPLMLFLFFALAWWRLLVVGIHESGARAGLMFFTTCAFCFIITNSVYAFWQSYMMAMAMVLLLSTTTNKKSVRRKKT